MKPMCRALILAMLVGAVSPALAQEASEGGESDLERAKALSLKSTQLYAEARYEEAVEALREAYELAPRAALLYNMATPLERLGRWNEALDALKGYRPSAKPEELDAIDRRITNLEMKVAQQRADREAVEAAKNQPAVEPSRKGPPAGAWVLLGTGAVGLGSGTVFTLRALSARSDWTGQCTDGDARLCPASATDAVSRDRSSSLIADVSWVVGIGATGAGLAIALGGKKKEASPETAKVYLQAAPQHVGLTVVPGLGRRGGAR